MTPILKAATVLVALAIIGGGYYYYQGRTATPAPAVSSSTDEATTTGTVTTTHNQSTHVILKTSKGDIELQLFPDKAPKTVENFLKLAGEGFYNGTRFHRVIAGFMIQGGDPLSKDVSLKARWGTGGPGYSFADELSGSETYPQGTLAMANAGPNTNGSQFFIVTASPAAPLTPDYTVFGKVVKGMDVALAIEKVPTGPNDQPVQDVTILKAVVE